MTDASNTSNTSWTDEQIAAYAQRFGLELPADQAPAMLKRLRELADVASTAGRTLPRQTGKEEEPASLFKVPLTR